MRLILLSIVFLLISCTSGEKSIVKFDTNYPQNYNSMIKWKRIERTSVFFKDSEDYIQITDKYKNYNIEKFKILSIKKINEYKYKVFVERSEVAIDSNVLKDNRYYQYWHYNPDNNSWYIKKEIAK